MPHAEHAKRLHSHCPQKKHPKNLRTHTVRGIVKPRRPRTARAEGLFTAHLSSFSPYTLQPQQTLGLFLYPLMLTG